MEKLTPEERAKIYNKRFPTHPPLSYNKRWITGAWYFFRSKAGKIYGSYPDMYLKRVYTLFPDCTEILHLFSGALESEEKGTRFDISPEFQPDVCGDVRKLEDYFSPNSFDLVIADPPYGKEDFAKYGCEPFNKGKVTEALYSIVRPRGFMVWLDTIIPMYRGKHWQLMGMIAFGQGSGMRCRLVNIFQSMKKEEQADQFVGEDLEDKPKNAIF